MSLSLCLSIRIVGEGFHALPFILPFQIVIYRFVKAIQTNVLILLVLPTLLNVIISSLLLPKGGQGKFRFFPYPPLAPPNPIKTTAQAPQGFFNPLRQT